MMELEKIAVDIGHGFKIAASDVARGVEALPKVIIVLCVALKDEPGVRDAVVGLISTMKPLIADGAADFASKGLNLPEDVQTIRDLQGVVHYVKDTFIPKISAAYHDEKDALEMPAPAAPVPAIAPAAPLAIARDNPAAPVKTAPAPAPEEQPAPSPAPLAQVLAAVAAAVEVGEQPNQKGPHTGAPE